MLFAASSARQECTEADDAKKDEQKQQRKSGQPQPDDKGSVFFLTRGFCEVHIPVKNSVNDII